MTLLDLPVDIWASYVVPLVNMSDMVRTAGCSKASGGLVREALAIAPLVVIVAPSDLHACLSWLQIRLIFIDQLLIHRNHQTALATAKLSQFSKCFREIALKFSGECEDVTGGYDSELSLLLHNSLAILEIDAPAVVPVTLMAHCLGCREIHSITYTIRSYEACDQTWLVEMIRASRQLSKLHVGQRSCFDADVFTAIAERKDTLTDVAMWVGGSCGPAGNVHAQLRRLLNSCLILRRLTFRIDGGTGWYGDVLHGMTNKCPHLEELILDNIGFSGGSFVDLLLSCPKLCVCSAASVAIWDYDLERWYRQGGPKLHVYDLYWAVEQVETVVTCAALFEEVRTYHMHCSMSSWQTAAEALAYMPHLHTVCLYSYLPSLMPYIAQYCPHMRVLKFMRAVRPEFARGMGEALISVLPSLPNLEELRWGTSCGLGETGLMALAQHCPNLRVLDCECEELTDVGLIALVRGCPALKTLLLRRCRNGWVTDAFLHAIAQHCPCLDELRLPAVGWETPFFSHAVITEVIVACTRLRALYFPRRLLGDETAATLVVPAGRLRRLTIRTV